MPARKTLEIETIKDILNRRIEHAATPAERIAIGSTLAELLHEAHAYNGFNYTEWCNGGYERWIADGRPDFPQKTAYFGDMSRVHYY